MPSPSNDSLLAAARSAILQAHTRCPEIGDIVSDSKHEVKARLQDFAFLQGFAFVVGSSDSRPGRHHCTEYRCHHHCSKTRNYRRHTDDTRQRQTHARKLNCPVRVVVKDSNQGERVITAVEWAHTHDPHPNPLILDAHRTRQPGIATATTLAQSHRELLSYSRSAEVIRGEGLKPLSSKEYYNLQDRAEKGGALTDVEEYHLIEQTLHHSDWRHRIRSINIINNVGEAERRVLQDIFFCSSEHITLARRFVNDFCYITDATFNTNRRRLPLAILTGIINTGTTFPFGYCFIVSESALAFEFIQGILTELFFYDRAGPRIVIGDFAAGLAAANPQSRFLPTSGSMSLSTNSGLFQSGDVELCQWHAVQAIRTKLVSRGYTKKRRERLTNLLWQWVFSPDRETLKERREDLLKELYPREKEYLQIYYQPKEHQFVTAYIKEYANLGAATSQRGEGNHHKTKESGLNRQLPLHQAVATIVRHDKTLQERIQDKENKQRGNLPIKLFSDPDAFSIIGQRITHFALKIVIPEWEKTKRWWKEVEQGRAESPSATGCQSACPLPLRYGLPCKHWMFGACRDDVPLPPSLFHPRWFFNEPAIPTGHWQMAYEARGMDTPVVVAVVAAAIVAVPEEATSKDRGPRVTVNNDRYQNHGRDHMISTMVKLQERHAGLTGWKVEQFAEGITKAGDLLLGLQNKRDLRHDNLPIEIPTNSKLWWEKPAPTMKRPRAMTSLDLVERDQRSKAQQRRQVQQKAEATCYESRWLQEEAGAATAQRMAVNTHLWEAAMTEAAIVEAKGKRKEKEEEAEFSPKPPSLSAYSPITQQQMMLVTAAAGTVNPSSSSSPSLSPPSYSPITQQKQWLLEMALASPQHSPNPIPESSNNISSSLWLNGSQVRKPSKKKAKAEVVPAIAKEIRTMEAVAKREKRAAIKAAKEEEAAVNVAARQRRREAVAATKALEVARRARKKVARAAKAVVEEEERSKKVAARKASKEAKDTLTMSKRAEKEAKKELALKISRNKVESQALGAQLEGEFEFELPLRSSQ